MRKKHFAKFIAIAAAVTLTAGIITQGNVIFGQAAPPEPPSGETGGGPGGGAGGPGGPSQSDISWSGATTITSAATQSGQSYSSTSADENAVLIDTDASVTLSDISVTKTGGTSSSDTYSFYGINSGIMAKGGTTLTINGGTITTDAAGANGVFSYGANSGRTNSVGDGTTVNISDVTITTTQSGSGGIMTTYGGTTNAKNLTITTSGGSSAPIRTDRGGGWVTVDGGTYTSNGLGSPAIYSTADVDVANATLISNKSEGVCIEGTGSIELTNCDLTANNTALNGNATFYDTIMIYQSQSGDASDGTSSFTMTGGSLNSKNGDTFHVTNTTAIINLEGVDISTASNGALISVCDDGWSGASNKATLNATDQILEGDILVGDDSTLNMVLKGSSSYTGRTSGEIVNDKGNTISTAIGTVNMTIEEGSLWVLTGNSTVSSLSGDGSINYNGYTLTVGSTTYSSGSIGNITETSEKGTTAGASMYRLYNPNSGEHLYTSNTGEKDSLVSLGWTYEGIAWTAPASSNTPVYRLYNPNSGEHHYTVDMIEKDYLVSLGWKDEGIGWYSDDSQGTPLYRLYNPNATGQYEAGGHHYTKDLNERDSLVAAGWEDEGIGWYGK